MARCDGGVAMRGGGAAARRLRPCDRSVVGLRSFRRAAERPRMRRRRALEEDSAAADAKQQQQQPLDSIPDLDDPGTVQALRDKWTKLYADFYGEEVVGRITELWGAEDLAAFERQEQFLWYAIAE